MANLNLRPYQLICEAVTKSELTKIIKEMASPIKELKQYIKSVDKNFMKETSMEVRFWNSRDNDISEWYIISYNWNDNDYPHKLNKFIYGIEDIIIKTLTRKGWRLKGHNRNKYESGILQKKLSYGVEEIDLYGGDNDGNVIGPGLLYGVLENSDM